MTSSEVRIANIVSPGAEHLDLGPDDLGPGVSSEIIVTKMDVPMANDPLRLALKDLVYVEAAARAENAGCDAIVVNTVADYGVQLIRGAAGIPVAGAGESAVAEARALGGTFAIVTVWPSSTQIYYDRVLRDTGSAAQCHSIRYVLEETELRQLGGGREVMLQAHDQKTPLAERVLASCKDAAARGAESVVLGCTCMTGLVGWLRANLEVPVVSPLHAGFAAARAAIADDALAGVSPLPSAADSIARVLAAVEAMAPMGASVTSSWAAAPAGPECGDSCAAIYPPRSQSEAAS